MGLRVLLLLLLSFSCCLPLRAINASVALTMFYHNQGTGNFNAAPLVYWQVDPASLHFMTTQQKTIVARIRTDIVLSDSLGILNEDHFILQTPPHTDVEALATITILEQRQYKISKPVKGRLKLSFRLTDMNDTTNVYSYTDSVRVAIDSVKPFYSGIKLLSFMDTNGTSLPLCANFLDDENRDLFYSAQIYNLTSKTVAADRYTLIQTVGISKKLNEAFLADYNVTDTITASSASRIKGKLHIGALLSGNYFININLKDKNGIPLATRSLFFQRLNAHPEKPETAPVSLKEVMKDTSMEKVTFLDLEKTFLARYDVQQLRAILKMLLPISDGMQTNTINNFLKKTDEMYMRYFIYNYFQDLNPKDPGKAWKEYSDKVIEVNKKYSANGNAGYETHRGFIYLRYGKPTDIITVTSESGSLPYEIWQYNIITQFSNKKELANALFLFYKQSRNLSDYFLLHSTVTGETMNAAWRSYLFTGSNGAANAGFNMNSRAEQYFTNR